MVKSNSIEEKPGVSIISPPLKSIRLTSLVVCFPLFKANDISWVLKFVLAK